MIHFCYILRHFTKLNDITDYIVVVCSRDFLPCSRKCGWSFYISGTVNVSVSSLGNRTIKYPTTESLVQLTKYVINKKKNMFYSERLGIKKHIFAHNITFGRCISKKSVLMLNTLPSLLRTVQLLAKHDFQVFLKDFDKTVYIIIYLKNRINSKTIIVQHLIHICIQTENNRKTEPTLHSVEIIKTSLFHFRTYICIRLWGFFFYRTDLLNDYIAFDKKKNKKTSSL